MDNKKKKGLIIIGRLSKSGAPLTTLHFIQSLKNNFDFDLLVLNSRNKDDLSRISEYSKVCKNIYVKNFKELSLLKNKKHRIALKKFILKLVNENDYNFVYTILGLILIHIFPFLKKNKGEIKLFFYSLGPGSIKRTGFNLFSNFVYKIKFSHAVSSVDHFFYISINCVTKKILRVNGGTLLIDYPEIKNFAFKKQETKNTLGMLATISKNKNQLFVIKVLISLLKYDNFNLIIMGNIIDKKYYKKIIKFIKKKNIEKNVYFMPGNDATTDFYEKINCLLLPSKREGLPLVLLESQFYGIPCVSSLTIPESANFGGLIRTNLKIAAWTKVIKKQMNLKFSINKNLKIEFEKKVKDAFDNEFKI